MQYDDRPIVPPAATGSAQQLRQTGDGDLRRFRISRGESQTKFWARFGVSQSNGCRFETGTPLPPTVALLIRLYLDGKWNDDDVSE